MSDCKNCTALQDLVRRQNAELESLKTENATLKGQLKVYQDFMKPPVTPYKGTINTNS